MGPHVSNTVDPEVIEVVHDGMNEMLDLVFVWLSWSGYDSNEADTVQTVAEVKGKVQANGEDCTDGDDLVGVRRLKGSVPVDTKGDRKRSLCRVVGRAPEGSSVPPFECGQERPIPDVVSYGLDTEVLYRPVHYVLHPWS